MRPQLLIVSILLLPFFGKANGMSGEGTDTVSQQENTSPAVNQLLWDKPATWTAHNRLNHVPASIYLPANVGASENEAQFRDPRKVERLMERVTVGGYFRFFGFNRNMSTPFRVIPSNPFANTPPYVIGVGDVYRDPPLMLLNIGARPTSKTYIGMDFAMPNFFTGDLVNRPPINLNLGINLIGSFRTDHGRFGIQAGGINWANISTLTFGAPEIFRFSLFERSPWDGNANSQERIGYLFENGQVEVDERFGQQPFKGLWLDGSELPGNMAFRLLWGKTPVNANLEVDLPSYTLGSYVRKYFKNNYISYNTINYVNYTDSLATEFAGINLHTISADFRFDGWRFRGEVGAGRLVENGEGPWGEAIKLKIESPAKVTGIPLAFEVFRIAPEFTNFFGGFLAFNATLASSNDQAAPAGVATGTAASFAGSITDVGQLANNTQGFNFNGRFPIGKSFKINFGLQAAQELERVSNRLSFGHKINTLPMSRFVTFSNGVGPYGRWNSFFRGVAEDVEIIRVDTAGLPLTKNGFNMVQVQMVQEVKTGALKHYVVYLASLGSVQDNFTPVPVFSDSAYLRAHYHELDFYFNTGPRIDLLFSLGFERIRGNEHTNRGDNVTGVVGELENDPLNQKSRHVGLGMDVKLSENAGLFVRHRRFRQQGESFVLDDIKGNETTVELKIFF